MATRRPPAPPPQARLTAEQMRKGIARLERMISQIAEFDATSLTKRWGSEQEALETAIEGCLSSVFGHGTVEYNRYINAKTLDNGTVSMSMDGFGYAHNRDNSAEARQFVGEGKERSTQILREAIRWLNDELFDADDQQIRQDIIPPAEPNIRSRKVFVVHGHDDGAREAVARFIERLGFEAVILKEQANQGKTIIEKIEAHSDVGFAVVLLTPDDVGSKAGGDLRRRARQNVLLELGYFIGKLSRSRVCALATSSDMELPTDFAGVVWEQFDSAGGWKPSLARELSSAGFEIDWNRVMRP